MADVQTLTFTVRVSIDTGLWSSEFSDDPQGAVEYLADTLERAAEGFGEAVVAVDVREVK